MISKQLLNVIMVALGFALALNKYTSSINPALFRAVTWFLSGLGRLLK